MPDKELLMNLKSKLLVSLMFLVLVTTSCSSDPYANAGKCESPGESKVIEEKVAVCTGLNPNFKWYFEGKYYEDTFLLAKIDYLFSAIGNEQAKKLKAENLYDAFWKIYDTYKLNIDDLVAYADGDERWDDLIELKSRLDRYREDEKYASMNATSQFLEWKQGKVSYEKAMLAQRNSERASSNAGSAYVSFKDKVQTLRGTLSSKYLITDRDLSYLFLSRLVAHGDR